MKKILILIIIVLGAVGSLQAASTVDCLNKEGTPLLFVCQRTIVDCMIGYESVRDKCVKIESKTNPPEQRLIPANSWDNIVEIASYKGKDCNRFGFSDVSCFVDSFTSCINAKIEDTRYTVEGDPVTMIAMIRNKDGICTIDVFEDTTKDRFGDQKITKHSCSDMKLEDAYLNISPCTKGSDDGVYGFSIQKPS